MKNSKGSKTTLAGFQKLNKTIYEIQDKRVFSNLDLAFKLTRYVTRTLKGVRKGDRQAIAQNLVITLSWAMAIGNRLNFDIDTDLWRRFLYRCPHCNLMPCSLHSSKNNSHRHGKMALKAKPKDLDGYQAMFKSIYPKNTLQDSSIHLIEEAGETSEAMQHYVSVHTSDTLEKIRMELLDVVANSFAVANCSNLVISELVVKMYANGCVRCHNTPCSCGVTVSDDDVLYIF